MRTSHLSQSFLLPQFGGVVLLNPPFPSVPDSAAALAPGEAYHLSTTSLAPTFHLFTQQLYSLLALPPYPDRLFSKPSRSGGIAQLQRVRVVNEWAAESDKSGLAEPFSRWQLETVLRQRMRENEDEARKTLSGIVRLVKKIKEMQLGEGVRGKVLGAVERLEQVSRSWQAIARSLRCGSWLIGLDGRHDRSLASVPPLARCGGPRQRGIF
jgi:phosphatidylinositol glycan class S